ncbi:unnamed protein product [Allacma fusca]|uniref:NAD(+) ADP-ribosyltransferase n=1 Tax=Allacma fusca TaxID=39272 RepID=A0A8J2M9K2_9HEXA|nr:unnamed protein product [Allacma fusca]
MVGKKSQAELNDSAKIFQKACETGDLETVRKIFDSGNFPIDEPLDLKWSGLQHACYHGKTEVVQFLLAKGADPAFKRENDQMNVLHATACSPYPEHYGAYDCCKIVLETGAKVSDTMSNNITPLIFAVKRCHHKITSLLLENGSNINHQDSTSRTALDWACLKGYTEVVEILLTLGADVTIRNKHGWTAEEVAYYEGHFDIVDLFEKFLSSANTVKISKSAAEMSMKSEENPFHLLQNYRQIRAQERNYLHLVLRMENLGKYFDLFQIKRINYSRFLKMTDTDLEAVGVMNDDDRALILDLIKNLNKGVTYAPKHSHSAPAYDELTIQIKNMDAQLQLMIKKHNEFSQAIQEDPSILQSGSQMELVRNLRLAIEQLSNTTTILSNSLKDFEQKCVPEKEKNSQIQLEAAHQSFVSVTSATADTSGRAILRLSALAGIMLTVTFIAKNISK